ncbi:hypothetical protein B0J11DRAFT_521314 [Dendryphion nanum]|uniref:Synaptobrevin n=1 Tax=Dendryphion nanum TaxID=256645 RepID=A0A9P9E7C9_9PLEO|nr:hypothetical protein B0J11DRAFT_521314 [Dendryphion nanum]
MQARSRSPSHNPDTTTINLSRLLSRLEHILLSPEASPNLRISSLERTRVGANVEYARTLLLNLEHSAASSSLSKSKKAILQSDLQQKRELIKQLNQRLYDLDQLDDSDSENSIDSSDDEGDKDLPSYAPRVQEEAGIEVTSTNGQGNEALQQAAKNLTSEIRRRGASGQGDESKTTSASLFTSESSNKDPAEVLLAHNRQEQDAITSSLLEMAKQLKQQSQHFGATLEGDKGILDRAVQGLDKSTLGMDAASQRMGTLRRMTEGKGWWDRMKLYALIFGLWIAAFLIVFVGPKIRF